MADSDLTLYHFAPSRTCRVLWLIYELGLEVRLKNANFIEDASCIKSDDYKKINPMEKVPALTDKAGESGACMLYLLEQYGNGRLEPSRRDAAARGQFLQLMFLGETEMAAHLQRYIWHDSIFPEDVRKPQVAQIGKDKALQGFDALEKILEGKDYLVNDEFSAADIAVSFSCNFLKLCKLDDEARFPNVKKYTERLAARPAFQKAYVE